MMKVLITGATGFIGSQLLNDRPADIDIRAVVRNLEFECDDFEAIYVPDINSKTCWKSALFGIDVVIHLAGIAHNKNTESDDLYEVNVKGTENLFLQASVSGVSRFIFISSIGVHGLFSKSSPFTSSSEKIPHNEYTKSKSDAEEILISHNKSKRLDLVIIRPTLVYGAGAPGNFSSLVHLISNVPFLPFGCVNNSRDFIFVKNLSSLLWTCAFHPKAAGEIFLASDSNTMSLPEFIKHISNGLGKRVLQLPIPISLLKFLAVLVGKGAVMEQLTNDLHVDSSDLKNILSWEPPFSIEQAMDTLRIDKK